MTALNAPQDPEDRHHFRRTRQPWPPRHRRRPAHRRHRRLVVLWRQHRQRRMGRPAAGAGHRRGDGCHWCSRPRLPARDSGFAGLCLASLAWFLLCMTGGMTSWLVARAMGDQHAPSLIPFWLTAFGTAGLAAAALTQCALISGRRRRDGPL